jgi:hypothetical protein
MKKTATGWFLLLAICWSAYAGIYIQRSSFVIGGERYFCLFDDGMISMQYARNLAQGRGLVFNPGERVEGYTNPLWVLLMAAFHLLPIAASKVSLGVQCCGALFLLLNLAAVFTLARRMAPGSVGIPLGAGILTAAYLPLNTWGLQGMEVSVLALLVTGAALLAARSLDANRFAAAPYWLLGVGTLVRPDMVVPLLGLTIFMGCLHTGFRRREWAWGIGLLVLFTTLQTAFRWLYYGEFLPNTYYLKVTQYPFHLRVSRGLFAFAEFALKLNWLILAIPPALALFKRDRRGWLLAWIFACQSAYSIYIGGDAWEWWGGANRYLCVAISLFFVLLAIAIQDAAKWLAAHVQERWPVIRPHSVQRAVGVVVLLACLLNLNALGGSLLSLMDWVFYYKPFECDGNRRRVELALHLKEITKPEARIAVIYAGAIPYFCERYTIDLLGKIDKAIARRPMLQARGIWKWIYFYPGHLKRNYDYSIGELKPDVVAGLWYGDEQEARRNLKDDYVPAQWQGRTFYVRKGSPNILWDRIEGNPGG